MTTSAPSTVSASATPRLRSVAVTATADRCGAKVSSSPIQVPTTLVGATTSTGPRASGPLPPSSPRSCARTRAAMTCKVLPRPMSSARMPPMPASQSRDVRGPTRALLVDDAQRDELVPQIRVVGAEPQPAGLGVGDVAGLLDEVAQSEQLGPV